MSSSLPGVSYYVLSCSNICFQIYNDPVLQGIEATADATSEPVASTSVNSIAPPTDTLARTDSGSSSGSLSTHTREPRPTSSTPRKCRRKMPCDDSDEVIHEALNQLKELSSKEEDGNASFGSVVANDPSLMSPNSRIYAKKLISDILFLGKLGNLSSATTVK